MDYRNMVPKAPQQIGGLAGSQAQYATDACEPVRQPQIQTAMMSLEASANDIRERIKLLEQRLAPVLRPISPENAAGENNKPLPTAPLADAIGSIGNNLYGSYYNLNQIIERIEL